MVGLSNQLESNGENPNERIMVDRGPSTPQPFLSQRQLSGYSAVAENSQRSGIRSAMRGTPLQHRCSTSSPAAAVLSRIPSAGSSVPRRSRTASLGLSLGDCRLTKATTMDDQMEPNDHSERRQRGRALGLTSPRCLPSTRRAQSQAAVASRKSVGAQLTGTPVKSTLLPRGTVSQRGRVSELQYSAPRTAGGTASVSAHITRKLRKDTDGLSGGFGGPVCGTVSGAASAAVTNVTTSGCRTISTQRSTGRTFGSASRRFYRDQQNFPETFEGITLDPTKFSSEKIRKDASLVILKYLSMKNYAHPISQQDLVHCPSTQLYIHLMQFLFNQVDPTTELFVLDEKVTSMFKILGYPLQFAKSHFRSPCTPLMWPQHLASIAWLCALLIFDETVLRDLARPATRDTRTETVQCTVQTPRVIGGARHILEELRSAEGRRESTGPLNPPKSPFGVASLRTELLDVSIDHIRTEPFTVALVRTIQNAYMLHRQQGKEVDEEDLARLLDADLAKFRAREEEILQDALAQRDAAKEAYEIEKAKLDEIGNLQIQAAQQLSDTSRFETRIQTTEKLIEDKKRRTESLKVESASRALQILELQQQVHELSNQIVAQGVSKEEAQRLTEKASYQRRRLEEKQKDATTAQAEWIKFNNYLDQLKEHVECVAKRCAESLQTLRTGPAGPVGGAAEASAKLFSPFDLPVPLSITMSFLTDEKVKSLAAQTRTLFLPSRAPFGETDRATQLMRGGARLELGDAKLLEAKLPAAKDSTLFSHLSPELRAEVEEVLRAICHGVSWSQWQGQLRQALLAQANSHKQVTLKIEELRKIRGTIEKSIEMKNRKITCLREDIAVLESAMTSKGKKHRAEMDRLQKELESLTSHSEEEVQRLKAESEQLEKALADANARKHAAVTLRRSTERKAAERLQTWIKAMQKEADLVASKLVQAKAVVMRENRNLEVLLSLNKNTCKQLVETDGLNKLKKQSTGLSRVSSCTVQWPSTAEEKGLPHLLAPPTVEGKPV